MLANFMRRSIRAWVSPGLAHPLLIFAIALGYFLLSRIAEWVPVSGSPIGALWLPAGLAVAVLFLYGSAALPAIAIGALAAAARDFLILGDLPRPTAIGLTLLFTLINSLLPGFIWVLYRLLQKGNQPFRSEPSQLAFTVSVVTVCILAGLCSALADQFRQTLPSHSFAQSWTLFSLANACGIFLLTPAILLHAAPLPKRYLGGRMLELLAWSGLLAAILYVSIEKQMDMPFLALPLLVWAATRFHQAAGALAILVTGLACFAGPLLNATAQPHLLGIDYLSGLTIQLTVSICLALYISTLLEDRNRIETRLEDIVNQRTRELEATNQELQDEIFIRKQAERSFRTSSRRYRALIETAGSPIIVMERDFTIRQWNSAAERLFGYQREDIVGRNYIQCFVPAEYQDETAWKITKVLESGVGKENLESEAIAYDGTRHVMLWNINRLVDSDERLTQAIIIGQDITDIRQTQDRLHYLAHYDVLTGVANRRLFEDRCKQAIKSAQRNRHLVVLMHLDVDHFKRINDTLGHDAGDVLLKEIAARLQSCVRKEDTIARLGGDEFAVLLHQVNSPDGAELVARNILETIVQPIALPNRELVITTSIGITLAPSDGSDYHELLKNADMAMYRAKAAGRNNIQFYRNDMNDELRRQLQLEQELRVALQEHQFCVYYQPLIDIEQGRIIGLEALLRWNHPTLGLLRPKEFLKVAEQSGLLLEIGDWVIHNTCLQGKAVQAMSEHPVRISVNLSQRQFQHPALADTLERIVRETQFNPRYIALEINESSIVAQPDEAIRILERLKRIGVSLTIDSFGSGFSSLIHLSRLPAESVKIDRRFIKGIPDHENEVAITETLLTIAHKMGLRVIAEGIEHQSQEAFFQRHQCRTLQGHYYSEPVPDTQLPQLFHNARKGRIRAAGRQIGLPLEGEYALKSG